MGNANDPVGLYFLTVLLAVSLNGGFSVGYESPSLDVKPENAIISERQNVTLHCTASNVTRDDYRLEWSHSLQNIHETLQSNRTSTEDIPSKALHSSLTLSNPGSNFIASLHVCELHSNGHGGNPLTFDYSTVSQRTFEKRLECIWSGGPGKLIHLFPDSSPVIISCKVAREPIVELRWKALHRPEDNIKDLLDFVRDDNGVYRYINSTLRWDPRLNGLIVYCKATTYNGSSAPAKPCVVGLVKVVQQPRIIPSNTSIIFGLANEVKFSCDVRGLPRQACSYSWTCDPTVPNCQSSSDTLLLGVNETTSNSEDEVRVICQVDCTPDLLHVLREAHATLTIQRQPPVSAQGSLQQVAPSSNHTTFTAVLELYSKSDDVYVLKCAANLTGYQPTFTWYIDGERVMPNIDDKENQQGMYSYYRLDHSFIVVLCEVLANTTITRVWRTFAQLLPDVLYTSSTPKAITAVIVNTSLTDDLQSSSSAAIKQSGFSKLSVTSRQLIIMVVICGSMAVIVFLGIALCTFKRILTKRNSKDISKIKDTKTKPQKQTDDTGLYLTPISGEQKGISTESSGDYAYPAFQKRTPSYIKHDKDDPVRGLESTDPSWLHEANYEEIPNGELYPQLQHCQIAYQNVEHQYSSAHSSSESYSPSSSSPSSSSPALIHEYDSGHGFSPVDIQSPDDRSSQLHHEYFH